MSVESIAVALHHSRAKGTDKLILLGIANHDGDGGAWPSHETLAHYGSCSITRVKQAIRTLVDLGEISVEVRAGGNADMRNDRRPNRYHVLLTCPTACDGTPKHRTTGTPSDCREAPDDRQKQKPRQALFDATTGTPSVQEPSFLEPSTKKRVLANAGDEIAKAWWNDQTPKPIGKGAWFSLLTVCREATTAGWEAGAIRAALNRIGTVPSVAQLDRELRSPRAESWAERKAREEREERDAIARRREQERLANLERERQRDAEAAQAVPPPPEFREAVARLRGRTA